LLALTLLVSGCGDGDGAEDATVPAVTAGTTDPAEATAPGTAVPEDEPASDPKSDEDQIKRTLEQVITGNDPDLVCGELVTERYLRRSYGDVSGCVSAQAQVRTAKRMKLHQVVVLPDSIAQAVIRPTGGIYDGNTLRAELVLDAGTWKVDSLRSNVPVGP